MTQGAWTVSQDAAITAVRALAAGAGWQWVEVPLSEPVQVEAGDLVVATYDEATGTASVRIVERAGD